jgi:hypothetical protein
VRGEVNSKDGNGVYRDLSISFELPVNCPQS